MVEAEHQRSETPGGPGRPNVVFHPTLSAIRRMRTLAGSGIGLTIARAQVEAHGGHIWAESVGDGQGSTFVFTLPVEK